MKMARTVQRMPTLEQTSFIYSPTSKTFTNFPRNIFSLDVVHHNRRNHHYNNKLSYRPLIQSWQAAEGYSNVSENIGKPFAKEPKQICSQAMVVAGKRPLPARATAPSNKNIKNNNKIVGPFLVQAEPRGRRKICEKTFQTEPVRPSWIRGKKQEGVRGAELPNEFFGQFFNVGEKR